MSARHAGYHAFGAAWGLSLVTSGMAGVFLTGASPDAAGQAL